MTNPRISDIRIYPVKGCAGKDVAEAYLTRGGLVVNGVKDHQYVVVSTDPGFVRANPKKGEYKEGLYYFLTQRDRRSKQDRSQGLSVMALIRPETTGDGLRLTWDNKDPIDIPGVMLGDFNYGDLPTKIWEDEFLAEDKGDRVAEWLSDHLGLRARLVRADASRRAKQDYVENDNPIGTQDAHPVHWFPIESVIELSQRMGSDISWQAFRPQVVVADMPAQYEHRIATGEIAGIPFIDPNPCYRCPVTMVDPKTGIVRKDGEPLKTLQTYKRWRKSETERPVIFGENMLPLGEGIIRVGSQLTVSGLRDPPIEYD